MKLSRKRDALGKNRKKVHRRLADASAKPSVGGVTGREIREALEQAGVRPNRQLGQNFLCDPEVAGWIVDQLEPEAGDTIVEVGPGTGALSSLLLGRVKRLVLVEFDSRLAAWLKERFAPHPEVEVHHADGARFDPRGLWKYGPVKFLGNLPYSSGGAIMKNFLSKPHPFKRAVIMLQKEVIDRLGAQPRTKEYGVLTLRIQSGWKVSPLKVVPPEAPLCGAHPQRAVRGRSPDRRQAGAQEAQATERAPAWPAGPGRSGHGGVCRSPSAGPHPVESVAAFTPE